MEWINEPEKSGVITVNGCWVDICTFCLIHGCRDHFGCNTHSMS